MIYFFTVITIILLIMLVGGKETDITGSSKYSAAFIASIIVTGLVYIFT